MLQVESNLRRKALRGSKDTWLHPKNHFIPEFGHVSYESKLEVELSILGDHDYRLSY